MMNDDQIVEILTRRGCYLRSGRPYGYGSHPYRRPQWWHDAAGRNLEPVSAGQDGGNPARALWHLVYLDLYGEYDSPLLVRPDRIWVVDAELYRMNLEHQRGPANEQWTSARCALERCGYDVSEYSDCIYVSDAGARDVPDILATVGEGWVADVNWDDSLVCLHAYRE